MCRTDARTAIFDFIAGYEKRVYKDEDAVNLQAAELMGKLHDCLKEIGYMGHDLEVYLVRLLFCLFADDTGIFNQGIFWEYIDLHTKEDGSNLAMHIASIFQFLNTPEEKRLKNLDENLTQFPYINGKLFEESLPLAAFDSKMRVMLLEACAFDWGKISPAIFGSMFQAVMNPKERRNLGAHYTSEKNIQKVIKPLFLDDLHREFEKIKGNRNKLLEFQKKIANLYFLDPACGCGNFLIITYRELRNLEILVLQELDKTGQLVTDISTIIQVDVNQFAGIEYDEFAVRVAEVAMWLIDHQMNIKVSNTFGQYFVRLPLKKSAKIVNGNALRIDWEEVISKEKLNFILGNPPFVGAMIMNDEQRNDMAYVFDGEKGIGVLDYVCAWYIKAAQIIQGNRIRVAFVSTNSISQGEQVALLWNILFQKYHLKIHFAHRTFKWSNEAKGNAAVHCVIIGFGSFNITNKILFDYEDIQGESLVIQSNNINHYLVDGSDIIIFNRSFPLSNIPLMRFGSMPRDGGNFIFTEPEKEEFLKLEPKAEKWIRPYTGAQEFINGYSRYCLWLVDISPTELKTLPEVIKRVDKVKNFRLKSKAASTRKFAATPTLFCQIAQPDTNYLLVPRVSSERRKYIPIGFMNKNVIGNDQVLLIPNANLYLFGILTSEMHMAWVKYVCGRLKSDYRYSKDIVYNNFPPPDLLKAHQKLDKAVDLCYRPQPFTSELNRIEYLFELYEKLTAPLLSTSKQKTTKRKNPQ